MEDSVIGSGMKTRTVGSGRGTAWWTESWALFMKNPAMWLVFGVIVMVMFVVLGMIPMIGGLIAAALAQVIAGGWMLSARKLEAGGTLEVGDLFSGFKDKINPLMVVGGIAIGASLVIVLIMSIIGGGAMLGMMAGGVARSAGGFMAGAAVGLLALLVGIALSFVVAMALWFAPALVVLGNLEPVQAVKASWAANVANLAAFLVYGLLWIVAAVVASIPFGLGWLVLAPLTMLGMYCAYKDIFEG